MCVARVTHTKYMTLCTYVPEEAFLCKLLETTFFVFTGGGGGGGGRIFNGTSNSDFNSITTSP